MAFPPRFLDELRARLSLAEVVGRQRAAIKRGREYVGLCPFHNEKTPSFSVVEDKGFYHCFGCGAHGDVIGFAMQTANLGFPEAVEELARRGRARGAASRRRRSASEPSGSATSQGAMEAACAFFERAAARAGGPRRARLSRASAASTMRRSAASAWASRRTARDALKRALAQGISRGAAARGRAAAPPRGRRRQLRLFPRPRDLPDRRPPRPRHRLRRPRASATASRNTSTRRRRRSSTRAACSMAGRGARAPRAGQRTPLGDRHRRLHGRDRAAPRRLRHRGGAARHRAHRDAARGAVAPGARAGAVLRRRRRRPARRRARALERALPLLQARAVSLRFAMLPAGEDPDTLILREGADAMRAHARRRRGRWPRCCGRSSARRKTARHAGAPRRARAAARGAGAASSPTASVAGALPPVSSANGCSSLSAGTGRASGPGGRRFGADGRRRLGVKPSHAAGLRGRAARRAAIEAPRASRKILLASLLNHPALLNEVAEDLAAAATCRRADLDKLCHEILNISALQPGP